MELLVAELLAQARRIWKYRWLGLAAAWVLGLVGLAASFALPDQFQAQARIYVDTQSILKPLMSGLAVQPNVDEQVKMLSRTLISRPNIEKLVRMADLDLKKQTKAEQEALIDSLMRKLTIGTTGRDNLYTLGYQDSDPEAARRVVQSLVSIFVESSLGASRKDTATATTFINEQIKTYEAKLEEAEQRLKEFRLRNLDSVQGDGKDATARIAEMHAQLERAKLELREAENARDAARAQLDAERKQTGTLSSVSLLPEATGLSLRPNWTPDCPNCVATWTPCCSATRTRIPMWSRCASGFASWRSRSSARWPSCAKRQRPPVRRSATSPGCIRNCKRMMATAEVQVAALKARVSEYQSRYAAAMSQMKTAPQIEAEAAQLNRDYEIHRKNYNDLVARRESAAMSGELDVASGVADFRLIDPPRVSPKPVAPNRFLLLSGALIAALLAGLFTAFAASQLRPVYFNSNELRQRTELPVLGVVSRIISDGERRRSRADRLRVIGATGGLVATFVVAMAVLAILNARQLG
jgi:uncharacterized protein involved in exopolysaccharide biosynthesis